MSQATGQAIIISIKTRQRIMLPVATKKALREQFDTAARKVRSCKALIEAAAWAPYGSARNETYQAARDVFWSACAELDLLEPQNKGQVKIKNILLRAWRRLPVARSALGMS